MKISAIVSDKGGFVATIAPGATVAEAVSELARHKIGALVVATDSDPLAGILSERDIVRRLEVAGAGTLSETVSEIMSTDVRSCGPGDEVESLRDLMTTYRIRHVPVVVEGRVTGIVSIGDIVKSRLGELEGDRQALEDYINAR